ncbi:MAG: hypothetical protein CMI54_02235 [Parcubacteria group bacterium]|nr:hypothetical protein [Parcubacteria group bacterium]|tara:strand:- start:27 stop:266 length:240 start_codon:yes stop_codon:yes gene_type:complete
MEYIEDKAAFLRYIAKECHCVNAAQSAAERRFKYKLVRGLGINNSHAERMRDWRYSSIARRFGFQTFDLLIEDIKERVK